MRVDASLHTAVTIDALASAGATTGAALTGGFSWLFLGAAALSVIGAAVAGFARRH